MIYSPHRLQKRVSVEPQMDEFGRIIPNEDYAWEDVCHCRCDNNDTTSFVSENGHTYSPKYHVVCDGQLPLQAGDYIRCISGDEIRGEGEVYRVKRLNLLPYTEVWI